MKCTPAFVVAKDTKNGIVLLGGLGVMGVGQMCFPMEERHKEYEGFIEAEERELAPHVPAIQSLHFQNAMRESEILRKGEG